MLNEGDIVAHRMLAGQARDRRRRRHVDRGRSRARRISPSPSSTCFGNKAALGEDFHITGDSRLHLGRHLPGHRPRALGRRAEDRPCAHRHAGRYKPRLGRPAARRQDLDDAVRQFQGQARRRRLHAARPTSTKSSPSRCATSSKRLAAKTPYNTDPERRRSSASSPITRALGREPLLCRLQ